MNIVFVGARGSGKSIVAKAVSRRLGRGVASTDAEIVKKAGVPVSEYVAENGWDAFRDLETSVVLDLANGDDLVVDTGGGVVLRPENVAALKRKGYVIWLRTSIETLKSRLADATDRPSLTGTKSFVEEMEEILAVRAPIYESVADCIIDTDRRSVDEIAALIEERIRQAL
ncbi:MAG: hypothetical protein AMXMBFR84_19930 [Candidatus Hydrogenedentota bacterium]